MATAKPSRSKWHSTQASPGMSRGKLRLALLAFFFALLIPTGVLVNHAYGQLKWEAFHQYRQLAEEMSMRIDQRVSRLLAKEEARGFTDYQFLVVEGQRQANFLQRSPLSDFPVRSDLPGLIGWFQVDANGAFSTPLLPQAAIPADSYGLDQAALAQRAGLAARINAILGANRLVDNRALIASAPSEAQQKPATAIQAAEPQADASNETVATSVGRTASLGEKSGQEQAQHTDVLKTTQRETPEIDLEAGAEGSRPLLYRKSRVPVQSPTQTASSSRANSKPKLDSSTSKPLAQAAFDQLSSISKTTGKRKQARPGTLGRVDDLKLTSPYARDEQDEKRQTAPTTSPRKPSKKRSVRKELEVAEYAPARKISKSEAKPQSQLPSPSLSSSPGPSPAPAGAVANASAKAKKFADADKNTDNNSPSDVATNAREALVNDDAPRILTFESELDPFEFSVLKSGHFVLYRKVWRDGQRYIQGALIDRDPFLSGLAKTVFEGTALSRMSNLALAWQGDVLAAYSGDVYRSRLSSADELSGALLYRARLSAPFADMELVFSVTRLPAGPGASVILWTAAVLALVLVIGVWLMYRLGSRQLALAHQQRDFVSAVSHELRTPITSIRMYAEMLQEGWASEEKKRDYYQFIVQESERLSRLIANVLQLARMTRNDFAVQLEDIGVAQLMDSVRSKVTSQVEHAGFELHMEVDQNAVKARVMVDADAFSQCLINLVDNALKFSASATHKVVEVTCRLDNDAKRGDQRLNITVRDFGPGVDRDQMKKIFTLFYRSENELTRETVGTGIGLALVHQLMRAMNGKIDVANDSPGAIFTLHFAANQPTGESLAKN